MKSLNTKLQFLFYKWVKVKVKIKDVFIVSNKNLHPLPAASTASKDWNYLLIIGTKLIC